MRYLNPPKKFRRKNWFVCPAPPRALMHEAKEWCKQQKSDGCFYYHYTNTRWWFEKKEDAEYAAMWFALKYS